MNQQIRELILDWKDRGKASFNELPDDVQNVIVSGVISQLPSYRRFECMEDISMEQLQRIVAFNSKTDYLQLGAILSEILTHNMKTACEELYNSTTEDHEAANVDDRIDAIQARRFG
jgi:hypothetical protein